MIELPGFFAEIVDPDDVFVNHVAGQLRFPDEAGFGAFVGGPASVSTLIATVRPIRVSRRLVDVRHAAAQELD